LHYYCFVQSTYRFIFAVSSLFSGGTTTAATMPALAAAGLVWHAKDMLSNEQTTTLTTQPSILNWHDLPVSDA
jgi:hypothetical protein